MAEVLCWFFLRNLGTSFSELWLGEFKLLQGSCEGELDFKTDSMPRQRKRVEEGASSIQIIYTSGFGV